MFAKKSKKNTPNSWNQNVFCQRKLAIRVEQSKVKLKNPKKKRNLGKPQCFDKIRKFIWIWQPFFKFLINIGYILLIQFYQLSEQIEVDVKGPSLHTFFSLHYISVWQQQH